MPTSLGAPIHSEVCERNNELTNQRESRDLGVSFRVLWDVP